MYCKRHCGIIPKKKRLEVKDVVLKKIRLRIEKLRATFGKLVNSKIRCKFVKFD